MVLILLINLIDQIWVCLELVIVPIINFTPYGPIISIHKVIFRFWSWIRHGWSDLLKFLFCYVVLKSIRAVHYIFEDYIFKWNEIELQPKFSQNFLGPMTPMPIVIWGYITESTCMCWVNKRELFYQLILLHCQHYELHSLCPSKMQDIQATLIFQFMY